MSLHRRRGWSAGRFVSQSETKQLYLYVFLYLNKKLIEASVFAHVVLSITDDS